MRAGRRTRVALVFLLLIAITLITLDFRAADNGAVRAGRQGVGAVFGPIENGVQHVTRPIGGFFSDLVHARSRQRRIDVLQGQLAQLQVQSHTQGDVARESKELQQLNDLAGRARYTIVPAQVVASGDLSGFDDAVTLDVGSHDGIKPDMVVMTGSGLVGRVVGGSIGPFSCNVLLVTDPQEKVIARLARNGARGTVSGNGSATLAFAGLQQAAPPRAGDVVETYGSSGSLYPPGLPIGAVTGVGPTAGMSSLTATVRPFVDFDTLDVVGVVKAVPRTTAAAASIPPVPTVTVTVGPTVTVTATPPASGSSGASGSAGFASSGPSGASSGASSDTGGGALETPSTPQPTP